MFGKTKKWCKRCDEWKTHWTNGSVCIDCSNKQNSLVKYWSSKGGKKKGIKNVFLQKVGCRTYDEYLKKLDE